MTALYTAEATATGDGRNGRTRSSDGILDLGLAVPNEMGGPGGAATNPEQLFAAGYAACFHGALQVVARRAKTAIDGSEVTTRVGIGRNDEGGFGLEVALVVSLPGLSQEDARKLVEEADQVCPYSNAIRGNVEIELALA